MDLTNPTLWEDVLGLKVLELKKKQKFDSC
jgi:hypothetical protein